MLLSSALDNNIVTMKSLIQKELDALRPMFVPFLMKLWSKEGMMCKEDGCFDGIVNIEDAMSGFDSVQSMSCNMPQDKCYYLEVVNKGEHADILAHPYSRPIPVASLIASTES